MLSQSSSEQGGWGLVMVRLSRPESSPSEGTENVQYHSHKNQRTLMGHPLHGNLSTAHPNQNNWTDRSWIYSLVWNSRKHPGLLCSLSFVKNAVNSTHGTCWSIPLYHWSACSQLLTGKCFTQRFAELPSCKVSVAWQELREEALVLITKAPRKPKVVLLLIYRKTSWKANMSEICLMQN